MEVVYLRRAVGAAIISGSKILLARKKQSWILPGGKPEVGESDIDCLMREISEEVLGLEITDTRYYGAFVGKTPHKGDMLEATVYLMDFKLNTDLHPGAEIAELAWISADDMRNYNLSDITLKIVDQLVREGYL